MISSMDEEFAREKESSIAERDEATETAKFVQP